MASSTSSSAVSDEVSSVSSVTSVCPSEFVTDMTAELFCNNTLVPLYLELLRGGEGGDDALYDQLRYDIRSLGLFLKPSDRALANFADALQDETISNGIALAVLTYARSVLCMETLMAGAAYTEDLPAQFVFELAHEIVKTLLDRGAYDNLNSERLSRILRSKRYNSLVSRVREQMLEAYTQRISAAIGPDAIGDDGEFLSPLYLRRTIDEISVTPPRLITFAAYSSDEACVSWKTLGSAPDLLKGFCRMRLNGARDLVRYIDVQERRVPAIKVAIGSAPMIPHYHTGLDPTVGGLIRKKCKCCLVRR